MFLNVTFAVASKPDIRNLLVGCDHSLLLIGSGTKSKWTSSPVFLSHRKVTMLSLSSSTDSPRLHTSCRSWRRSLLVSWHTCISAELCHSMVFRWRSVQIVAAFSPHDTGIVSWKLSGLVCLSAPLITHSHKAKLNESIKCWKTCFALVSFHSA